MATPTLSGGITNAANTINTADSTTGWTANSLELNPDVKVEGTNSVQGVLRQNNSTFIYTNGTGINVTNEKIRGWIQFNSPAQLDYMQLRVGNAYWDIFKGAGTTLVDDTVPEYSGGFFYAVVDYSTTPDDGTKAGTETIFGYRFIRTEAPRNVDNTNVDVFRYGEGYTATGGTAADPITFSGIADVDATDAYGIVQKDNDVLFGYGEITIGATSGDTYLEAETDVLVFPLTDANNSITATGASATFAATNSIFKANSGEVFGFDTRDVGTLICSTNSFIRANPVTFGGSQSVESCTFVACGDVVTNGASFPGCTFSEQVDGASLNPVAVTLTNASNVPDASELSKLADCTFNSPGRGYGIDLGTISSNTAVSVDLDNVKFNGYTAGTLGDFSSQLPPGTPNVAILVNYTGTAALTINVINGSTTPSLVNTGSGTVTLAAPPRTFTLNNLKDKTEVRLIEAATNSSIAGVENITAGVGTGIDNGGRPGGSVSISGSSNFVYSYQFTATTDIFAAIISASNFEIINQNFTLADADFSTSIAQQEDRNFKNPPNV